MKYKITWIEEDELRQRKFKKLNKAIDFMESLRAQPDVYRYATLAIPSVTKFIKEMSSGA